MAFHKYLIAGGMEDGGFHATTEGVPQGGQLSPLCRNVMLNELDKELERREPLKGTDNQREQMEQPGKRKETHGIYDRVD